MSGRKSRLMILHLILSISMILVACVGSTAPAPEIVIETVIVEGTPQVVEKIVTPSPEEVKFEKADKSTLIIATAWEPLGLDPAFNYQTAGNTVIMNVYETLIFYDRQHPSKFIPQLATDWQISEDGKTYTFTIREGVKFHEGQELTPEDVAYSFQRALLQGGNLSPMWLLTEPFFGIGIHDIAELIDPELVDDKEGLIAAEPDKLLLTCKRAMDAIVADNENWIVTMTLAQPWGPFLPTIAASWGSIIDKDWAIEQGAWDGDCATWQYYYGVDDETAPLTAVMNGTGPYRFDHWTPREEFVLIRNEQYWRREPAWTGGPSGPAATERIIFKVVDELGTRYAMFVAGDSDFGEVLSRSTVLRDPLVGEFCVYSADKSDFNCALTDNPEGPFRYFTGQPTISRADVFFVFDTSSEGDNPFLGSGKLDGNGVPPDFFSDINVRKAFNYCFDWEAFIQDYHEGEAVQNVGVLIPGMIGYDPDGPKYSFDLEKCKEHIELAWDGKLEENGFRLQFPYISVSKLGQTVAQILQSGFQQVDPKYEIELVGLAQHSFWNHVIARRVPIFADGWKEDIHDPHNWAYPFTVGIFASVQAIPQDIRSRFLELVNAGVAATDDDERERIYRELQEYDYEVALGIRLAVPSAYHLEQRWIEGFYYNPIYPYLYFYPLSIK